MKRLEVIASYIPPYQTIADIGCDHGYLIKIAIDNYNIEKAFAVDNKEMPLQSAKNLLSNYPNVTFSLSYGISMLPDDIDVVVMSGMGGTLIKKIIEKDFEKLRNVKRIIVEANRDEQKVRTLLVNNHFKITNEVIMEEDGIIYEIIVFEKKDNVTNFKLNDDVFSII